MSHMEYKECPYLKPDFVEDLRTNDPHNSGKFEAIRSAISWGPIATGNLQLGPNDSAVDVSTRSLVFSEEVEPSEDGFLRNFVREKAGKLFLSASSITQSELTRFKSSRRGRFD